MNALFSRRGKSTGCVVFIRFDSGIAPTQTIRRVLAALDSKIFETLFTAWASRWHGPGVIAIDGKGLKGASNKDTHDALYTVSAFASESGMVLGQHKVHDKSNEITAIPVLLEQPSIKGNIVAIDAMGTRSAIAEAIRAKDAHYILALKGNQSGLRDDVELFFHDKVLSSKCLTHETVDLGHGRIEERFIRVIDAQDWLCPLQRWLRSSAQDPAKAKWTAAGVGPLRNARAGRDVGRA